MKKENVKRAFITVGLIGILAASPVMAEVSRLSMPSVGDTVEIDDLLLRVLAFPSMNLTAIQNPGLANLHRRSWKKDF